MTRALVVGSKAGFVDWGQITKDIECPDKALGLYPVSREWAVNDKIHVTDGGEDEWGRAG